MNRVSIFMNLTSKSSKSFRNFQELFEKTKAGLEELKKRRETRHGELPKASAKIQAVPLHSEAQPKVLLLDVEADSASLMEAKDLRYTDTLS